MIPTRECDSCCLPDSHDSVKLPTVVSENLFRSLKYKSKTKVSVHRVKVAQMLNEHGVLLWSATRIIGVFSRCDYHQTVL